MRFINVFCGDLCDSNIRILDSDYTFSFYKQWNVMAKTVFGTRYDTHVSVVDGFLCSDITSFKFYPDIPSSYESYLNQQARK